MQLGSESFGQSMANHRILVLADDLTGALEVGAKFAAAGVTSEVRTTPLQFSLDLHDDAGVLVIDTESRHSPPGESAEVVFKLARAARDAGFSHVYKKTDSTLRGNIGAELTALIEAFEGAPLLYAPAYPQMGRTVKGGSLFLDGIPVEATSFADDPFNPITVGHIPTLLESQRQHPIHSGKVTEAASFNFSGIAVCDGEEDADVESAARMFVQSPRLRLAAGPAGFAAHLARLADLPRGVPSPLPRVGNALVVNGSLHAASHRQVMNAIHDGFKIIDVSLTQPALLEENWAIVGVEEGRGAATLEFARALAQSVCRTLTQYAIDALVIFGGDTAHAIVAALGNPPIKMVGEVLEGIPVSRIEAEHLCRQMENRNRDLYLITKAGGFGGPETLSAIRNSFEKG
jgi:D-threonate/D-erythronate kinase